MSNNARITFNTYISTVVLPTLPAGWTFSTADSFPITLADKTLSIKWVTGSMRGFTVDTRIRMCQLEIFIGSSATEEAELAADQILNTMRINSGQNPLLIIPNLDWTVSPAVPIGTQLTIKPQSPGWNPIDGPSDQDRLYILTLLIDYTPG